MDPREKLIVALDVSTAAAAKRLVAAVGNFGIIYKIGLQLFTAEGPRVVRDVLSSGSNVFLDLKYHDIPNTVASSVREAAGLGVQMLTVHAMGGGKMLSAAAEAARTTNPKLKLLAVTVLTSLDQQELEAVGIQATVLDEVVRLAQLAMDAGCHGVVASAKEATEIRRRLGDSCLIVTPGVRPVGVDHGDQARVVTPTEAILAGASHIVVGRPIIDAADPAHVVSEILAQLGKVSAQSVGS